MTRLTGRRSHRGFYSRTREISDNAAESIRKWGFEIEIHRQTACVRFTKEGRTFFWHPVKKQFRESGTNDWTRLPPGFGVVALMASLHGKGHALEAFEAIKPYVGIFDPDRRYGG